MATLINDPQLCTFIHIPKTGGNSVTNWLQTNFNTTVTKGKQHATVFEAKDRLGLDDIGWTYCVVRNPWDWVVSWYEFRLMTNRYYLDLALKGTPRHKQSREVCEDNLKRLESLGFIGWAKKGKFKIQHNWAKDVDIIMKLDKIEEDFKFIQEKLNCFEPLPLLNKTHSRKEKDYRKYYDNYTIDLVKEKCKIDIENYGFEF